MPRLSGKLLSKGRGPARVLLGFRIRNNEYMSPRTGKKQLSSTAAYPVGFGRAIAHLHLDQNKQEAGQE